MDLFSALIHDLGCLREISESLLPFVALLISWRLDIPLQIKMKVLHSISSAIPHLDVNRSSHFKMVVNMPHYKQEALGNSPTGTHLLFCSLC